MCACLHTNFTIVRLLIIDVPSPCEHSPAGVTVATTWDKDLIYARGLAMGQEHRGKGVNVALGPMMNLGRVAAGGRNWEGFGADPFLTGVAARQTVAGMQDAGVIACAKH